MNCNGSAFSTSVIKSSNHRPISQSLVYWDHKYLDVYGPPEEVTNRDVERSYLIWRSNYSITSTTE
eukprot:scaffold2384_cov143-Skeletonema_menzelii.AAC.32